MDSIITWLVPVALIAVFVTLCFGIYAMVRGGDFGRSYSNKLMRLRVALQFIAVMLMMAGLYFST